MTLPHFGNGCAYNTAAALEWPRVSNGGAEQHPLASLLLLSLQRACCVCQLLALTVSPAWFFCGLHKCECAVLEPGGAATVE